jgi:hypothetical protein
MEQIVQVLSFGSAWWVRPGRDEQDPLRFTHHAAYFNSSGIQQASKIHMAGPIRGVVRFNVSSGLDPHRTHSNLEQLFVCSGIEVYRSTKRLLVLRRALETERPTHFLVCMRSRLHGTIALRESWCTGDVEIISMSRYRGREEELLLIAAGGSVHTTVGSWGVARTGTTPPRLELAQDPEHVSMEEESYEI